MGTVNSKFRTMPMAKPVGPEYAELKGINISVDYDMSVVNPEDLPVPESIMGAALASYDISYAVIIRHAVKAAVPDGGFKARYDYLKEHAGEFNKWTPGAKQPKGTGVAAAKVAKAEAETKRVKAFADVRTAFMLECIEKYPMRNAGQIVITVGQQTNPDTWEAFKATYLGELETVKQEDKKRQK